jgi:hypothetical protein
MPIVIQPSEYGIEIRSFIIPRLSRFAGDQRLDELSILIRDLYAVFLDEIIKHHLRGVFVLPFLVLAINI